MHSKISAAFLRFDHRKQSLLKRLDQMDKKLYNTKPSEREWSMIQVLEHLYTSDSGSLNYCRKKIKAGDAIPNAGILDPIKFKLYLQFLFTPIKFKAPKVVSAPSNDSTYEEVKARLEEFQNELKSFADSYPDKYLKKAIFRHPIAGRITIVQMIDFFEAHLRHHEYQINRLVKYYESR